MNPPEFQRPTSAFELAQPETNQLLRLLQLTSVGLGVTSNGKAFDRLAPRRATVDLMRGERRPVEPIE